MSQFQTFSERHFEHFMYIICCPPCTPHVIFQHPAKHAIDALHHQIKLNPLFFANGHFSKVYIYEYQCCQKCLDFSIKHPMYHVARAFSSSFRYLATSETSWVIFPTKSSQQSHFPLRMSTIQSLAFEKPAMGYVCHGLHGWLIAQSCPPTHGDHGDGMPEAKLRGQEI